MKVVIVIALSLVSLVASRPGGSYLPPSSFPDGSYLPPSSGYLPAAQDVEHKHVYFYGSPNGDLYAKLRINVIPASHKNTKIIFVKAPATHIVPEVHAPESNVEDKTLVYVLTKKPKDESITIPTGLNVKQEQPKVFFIKYNNKNDAAPSVSAGVKGEQAGWPVPNIDGEHAFVGTLGNGDSKGYEYGAPSGPY
uniref:DUF243 domain-containing protein n=1 Tax=Photinus pyralis TaxID=7054 RepID=A0A1Y1NCZ2_PHOPY